MLEKEKKKKKKFKSACDGGGRYQATFSTYCCLNIRLPKYIQIFFSTFTNIMDTKEKVSQSASKASLISTDDTSQQLSRYCRKIDLHILLYTIVLCILNQSDRSAIGVAKVVGLEKDLGLHHNDFNIAATLFTVGYLSLELFSNFVLKRVGASKLLPTLGILWGTVCASQGAISTKTQLYVMRTLLGMSECGFTTGVLLLISFFYPKDRVTSRVSLFYLSAPLANVLAGPLASGLSHINHPHIRKWQWVFIVEGLMTVAVSIPGYFFLQDHPEKSRFLTKDEKQFIIEYKQREGTLGGSQKLTFRETKLALMDGQLWLMVLLIFASGAGIGSINTFAPELINELGFSPSQSQAMSALPSICGVIAMLMTGKLVKLCRGHWITGILCLSTQLIGSIILVSTLNVAARMVGLCMVGAGGFAGLGIFPGWTVTANSRRVENSTVAAGLSVFWGASAGFLASNVFLNWDAPRFVIGHSVNIGLATLGILICVVVRFSMGRRNKKLENESDVFRFVY